MVSRPVMNLDQVCSKLALNGVVAVVIVIIVTIDIVVILADIALDISNVSFSIYLR